ncbi:hypothetical protein KBD13_01475 [Patescibacteria group bacterium]|nr:hypothetical protein [Patescibacteria group bacterium]
MKKSWMAARIATWPKWVKMTVLIVFFGFVAIQNIPLVASYLDLAKGNQPSGYIVETFQDGTTQKWTVSSTQMPNIGLTYILTNGENQARAGIYPEHTYFTFYRKAAGYVNFEGVRCPINGGRLYELTGSSRSGIKNPLKWNGDVQFDCPATNAAAGIKGTIVLGR